MSWSISGTGLRAAVREKVAAAKAYQGAPDTGQFQDAQEFILGVIDRLESEGCKRNGVRVEASGHQYDGDGYLNIQVSAVDLILDEPKFPTPGLTGGGGVP